MNILVSGAKGQLGSEIYKISKNYPNHTFFFTDIDELDLTKQERLSDFFNLNKIEIVINCAAYTSVDKAEKEKELAKLINVDAVKNLVIECEKHNAKLIHISTDYVFDGTHYKPYSENALTSPNSVYGKTKLDGEHVINKSDVEAIVIRTSWLYSSIGNNFVKTILRLAKERKELKIVSDQIGTPTYAADLADTILKIIEYNENNTFISGTYHYSNEGVCSWYDFAVEIANYAFLDCKITPIGTDSFPTPAKRPPFSVLNKDKIKKTFQIEIPHWRASLKKCIQILS